MTLTLLVMAVSVAPMVGGPTTVVAKTPVVVLFLLFPTRLLPRLIPETALSENR